jgi:hypothetical protein
MGRLPASGLAVAGAVVLAACSPTGISAHPKLRPETTTTVVALPATPPSSPPNELQSADGLLPAGPQLHDTLALKTSTAAAGETSISGTLMVVNSGEVVNLSAVGRYGCRPSYQVVLTSTATYPQWDGQALA